MLNLFGKILFHHFLTSELLYREPEERVRRSLPKEKFDRRKYQKIKGINRDVELNQNIRKPFNKVKEVMNDKLKKIIEYSIRSKEIKYEDFTKSFNTSHALTVRNELKRVDFLLKRTK